MSQFEAELPVGLESVGVFILYKMDAAHQGSTYRIAIPSVKLGARMSFRNAAGNYLLWQGENGNPVEQRFDDTNDRTVFSGDEALREVVTSESNDFFFEAFRSSDDEAYPVTYNLRVAQDFPGARDVAMLRWDADKNQFRVVLQGIHDQQFAVAFRKENFQDTVVLQSSETGESFTLEGDAPVYWVQDGYNGQTTKTISFKVQEPALSGVEVLGSDDGDLDIEPPGGGGQ